MYDEDPTLVGAIITASINIVFILVAVVGFGPVMDYLAAWLVDGGYAGQAIAEPVMVVFPMFYTMCVVLAVLNLIWVIKTAFRRTDYSRYEEGRY